MNALFIISSAIYITTNPLCYTPNRSAFSAEERALQTLKTIQSIRDAMPNSQILLIEMGLKKELPYNIEGLVDKYLFLGNRKLVREAADGPFKGLGEAIGLYLGSSKISQFNADYYFKLSGRYYLDEHFQVNDWKVDSYTAKDYYGGLFTVLYGFPARLYQNWRLSLKESMPVLLQGESIELIQAHYLEKPINYLNRIGASGWESHSGSFVSL